MKIESIINLLKDVSKPYSYWVGYEKVDDNSYNKGFNEGIQRAIRLLKIAERDENE